MQQSLNTYILLRALALYATGIVLLLVGWAGFIFLAVWFFRLLGWVLAAYDPAF